MSDHYYTPKPVAAHDLRMIRQSLRGRDFQFVTDAGVFSKNAIDFGSRLLIESVEVAEDAKVLDVGCGYGPIGIAVAAEVSLGSVTMIDINERAVELARENARRNGLANVKVMQSNMLEQVLDDRFHCILTNPPIRAGKAVVHQIFEQAYHCLLPSGQLWVVIQKKQGAPSAKLKLEEMFGQVEEITKDKGYRIFKATKTV
ncbi:Ribosomal RNA large subunit methyltransferase G [Chlamydia abortus]|uniref:Class I SAM-dependent methyltransferase n=1 Tax=Paenibacillus residui TaxID=629724 RepID=A0ABW3DIR3_9BACL|nr:MULTISPECIES: class I SAM-dependent methyltransferase [Paenibacillaceae]SHE14353.1 Ribosomal RNA large subunit methyltransferase G [Chlamydia abortus]